MNIDEALRMIAAENNFYRFDIGISIRDEGRTYFSATAWGEAIGINGCTSMDGETVAEAIANTVRHAGEKRAAGIPAVEVELAA